MSVEDPQTTPRSKSNGVAGEGGGAIMNECSGVDDEGCSSERGQQR